MRNILSSYSRLFNFNFHVLDMETYFHNEKKKD